MNLEDAASDALARWGGTWMKEGLTEPGRRGEK